MAVKVKALTMSGSPSSGGSTFTPVTAFVDTFARADEPFMLGENWYTIMLPTESVGITGPILAGQVNVVGGTDAQFGTGGGGFTCAQGTLICIPRPLTTTAVLGLAQFAQLEITAVAGVSTDMGPGVFMNPNNSTTSYMLDHAIGGTVSLWNSIQPINSIAGPFAAVAGQTIRVEIRPSAGSNSLRIFVNGVQQGADVVDASAGRPTTGMPGIGWWGNGVNSSTAFRNFSCGIL